MYARIFFVGFLFCNVALFSSHRQPLLTQPMDRGEEVIDIDTRYVQAYNNRKQLLKEHVEFLKKNPGDCNCCCYPSGDTYNPSNTLCCIPWTCIHQPTTKEELVYRLDASIASMIQKKYEREDFKRRVEENRRR
jgi:hypothetical protein